MRHRILNITAIIAIMAFSASVCQAQFQLLNPSFESWEGTAVNAKPTGWSSFPQSDGSYASLASTSQHYQRNGGRPGHSGSKYLTIYTRSILGIKANGNMTTGRIHAGSMSASNANNYNYTQRSSSYNHPFSGHPDSMYVWASFYAQNASSQAAIKAYIHGDSDFKDPNDTTDHSNFCAKASTEFARTTTSATTPQWVQFQMPFEYIGTTTANYILMSMATNATPGGGNANDSLSVDDIEFIYSAWLDGISLDGEPLADFDRSVLEYSRSYPTLADLNAVSVVVTTQSLYATATLSDTWLDDTSRLFSITITSEDSLTMKTYTLTLTAPQPVCNTVSDISATVEGRSAVVSWLPGEGNTSWEIDYGPQGFAHDNGTLLTTTDASTVISGLEYSTSYDLYIRSLCGDSLYTDWSGPITLATGEEPTFDCSAPDSVYLIDLYPTDVRFSWTFSADDSMALNTPFRVLVTSSADTVFDEVRYLAEFTSVADLTPNTSYTACVYTLCDSLHTSEAACLSFTTPENEEPTAIESVLSESWSIYPNPATDQVQITSSTMIEEVRITNLVGQTLITLTPSQHSTQFSTKGLPAGLYIVSIRTAESQTTKRLTVMRN